MTLKEIAILPILTVSGILAGLAAEHSLWLLAVPSMAIVVLLLFLLEPRSAPTPLTALMIAPDHVDISGQRVPMRDVRRIERLSVSGSHDVQLHTSAGTVLAARTPDAAHARYIADRLDDAYRAFLRKGTPS